MDAKAQVRPSWRVGLLFSQSGVTAAVERTQLNATELAIEEVNQAGGISACRSRQSLAIRHRTHGRRGSLRSTCLQPEVCG